MEYNNYHLSMPIIMIMECIYFVPRTSLTSWLKTKMDLYALNQSDRLAKLQHDIFCTFLCMLMSLPKVLQANRQISFYVTIDSGHWDSLSFTISKNVSISNWFIIQAKHVCWCGHQLYSSKEKQKHKANSCDEAGKRVWYVLNLMSLIKSVCYFDLFPL